MIDLLNTSTKKLCAKECCEKYINIGTFSMERLCKPRYGHEISKMKKEFE
jgi:hypothetical protein